MKLLIDTNIIFDVYERRQPHYAASLMILKLARRKQVSGAVASHTLADAFYRYGKGCLPFMKEDLLQVLEVVCGDAHQTVSSLNLGISDAEDALEVAAAHAHKAAFIITRNLRHFRKSNIPAMSPAEWIKRFASSESH